MEGIDSKFWATDEEREMARNAIILYAKDVSIPTRQFEDYGFIYSDFTPLIDSTEEQLPGLNPKARRRLLTGESEDVREELKASGKFAIALGEIRLPKK